MAKSQKQKRIAVSVQFSEETVENVNRIARMTGLGKTDVLGTAVRLTLVIMEEMRISDNSILVIEHRNGKRIQVKAPILKI